MNLFKAKLLQAGLSLPAASRMLDIALDTAKKWNSGRNPFQVRTIDEVNDYLQAADMEAARLAKMKSIGYYKNDAAAIDAGWPSKDAYDFIIAKALAIAEEQGENVSEVEFYLI